MRSLSGRLLAGACFLTLAGCVVGPRYTTPAAEVPSSLVAANAPASRTPLSHPTESEADLVDWWTQFRDPELNSLIERALASNLDRQTAASRVRQAQGVVAAQHAALLPSIDADGSYEHTRISSNSGLSSISSLIDGGAGSGAGSSPGAPPSGVSPGSLAGGPGTEFDSYSLGLSASYTVDVFGGARSAFRSAKAQAEAAVWSARDTEVTITSEVATAYFAARADQLREAVLQSNAHDQQDLLTMIRARAVGGLVTDVDISQQRSQLALTQATIGPVESDLASRVHQLGILLAFEPDAVAAELSPRGRPEDALPSLPPTVPIGLPSSLLRRRPDIRAAERQLAASVDDIDQATAALYPQIQLNGSFDFISLALKSLFDAASRNYSAGASVVQPLFDAGKLRAQKRQTEEQAIQATVTYRKSVLSALQQTADALAAYAADQRQLLVLRSGYADAARAAQLNRAQYLGGLKDLTATLQAEATARQTQDQLAQTQGRVVTDLVTLYRALGGGWSTTGPEVKSIGFPGLQPHRSARSQPATNGPPPPG